MASVSQHDWRIIRWDPRRPERTTQACDACHLTVTRIHPLQPPVDQPPCAPEPTPELAKPL
jgi:hypothetical protein